MSRHECDRCGLTGNDLPDVISQDEFALDDFFFDGLCMACRDLESS